MKEKRLTFLKTYKTRFREKYDLDGTLTLQLY